MTTNMNNFEEFFGMMKIEMSKQTTEIISQMDEKLAPFIREIEELKSENQKLKDKIAGIEKSKRFNNIIIFGIKETENSPTELMASTKGKIRNDLIISLDDKDINTIYRVGKKDSKNEKDRPILISFVNGWKKIEIMKNRNKFKDVYASEDYPREVLDKRKELQTKLIEERKKGNYAVIKYDKLIVREGMSGKKN
ncbi:Endonuclease-reverse transcriptase [Operophtera brumata]|uniref:Endonuclease-reverse transcriptase n=1 Tax=Operophtera brumata TaxID=104452 RepID=A0A0L7LNF8_OPEBR|nr:Endonuclease-reverse transcriptase [Operophtera brumata]